MDGLLKALRELSERAATLDDQRTARFLDVTIAGIQAHPDRLPIELADMRCHAAVVRAEAERALREADILDDVVKAMNMEVANARLRDAAKGGS
jgi:hypothetical protein